MPVSPEASAAEVKPTKVRFEFLEETREGKIWKIEALHVTTTKNRRKYTERELTLGARSLSYRPLNINHNDAAMLPYPENCTLDTDFDASKMSVSGRMRIADEMINRMIESGRINRLSVEQLPVQGETCDSMACEQHGVTFVGLALLTNDTTPGDGDTRITPASEALSESDQRVMVLLSELYAEPTTAGKEAYLTTAVNEMVMTGTTTNSSGITLTLKVEGADEARRQLESLSAAAQKLTGTGSAKKEDDYPWDQCIDDQMARYHDMDTAKKVCGAIKANAGGGESYAEAKKKHEKDFREKVRKALEAGDTQTSKCIAHFVDHGKDQDQAVAICLNDPGAAKEAAPVGDYKTIARRALVKVYEGFATPGLDEPGYDNSGGADKRAGTACPPGHHRMPDGTCMPDDDMETPDTASEKALSRALTEGLKKLQS